MSAPDSRYFYNIQTVVSEPRLAYVLLNHARRRALERAFGVTRDQQFLLTLILLGMAGRAVAAKAAWIRRMVPRPSSSDVLMGNSLLDEAAHMLAGDSTPDTPLVGSLVAVALLASGGRPLIREIQAASRSARAELARIPRYIIRLNQPDEPQSAS